MSINSGLIRGTHHVGLPSYTKDWEQIRAFWESLGLECRQTEVTDDSYDHAGAGSRLQIFCGASKLVVSYFTTSIQVRYLPLVMREMHLALEMGPQALAAARAHPHFERETHWGHSKTSVFLIGPYRLNIELVTENPDFHRND